MDRSSMKVVSFWNSARGRIWIPEAKENSVPFPPFQIEETQLI